ncbi:DNA polymerase [candidate division KSB1 bacterium]
MVFPTLQEMKEQLDRIRIPCKVEYRGMTKAISFTGYPCPSCKKTNANSRAYPPLYFLHCFNNECAAADGLSITEWAPELNIQLPSTGRQTSLRKFNIFYPRQYESIINVRLKIKQELLSPDNTLMLMTPGVGKSQTVREELVQNYIGKTVLYSTYNKKLQNEAFEDMLKLGPCMNVVKLEAKEEVCEKKEELFKISNAGYRPSELLCTKCEFIKNCQYFEQRKELGQGIYFVTHHMLKYIERKISNPDLLVLDEDILRGFLQKETCEFDEFKLLTNLQKVCDTDIIDSILNISNKLSIDFVKEQNSLYGKIIEIENNHGFSEQTFLELLSEQRKCNLEDIKTEISLLLNAILQVPVIELYKAKINYHTVNWLSGLIVRDKHSYIHLKNDGKVLFEYKYIAPLGFDSTPIKILDATGNKRVMESITKREIQEVKSDVKYQLNGFHIKNKVTRYSSQYFTGNNLKFKIAEALEFITGKKVLVVTYKSIAENLKKICMEVDSNREYEAFYFQGERGINKYSDCDGIIVLGLPYPNLSDSWFDASILFKDKENEDIIKLWPEVFMQQEIYQLIHRTRPLYKPVDLVVIADIWPSMLPKPTKTQNCSHTNNLEIAQYRLDQFVKEFGFINQDLASIANVYVKSKENKAIDFRNRIISVLDKVNNYVKCNYNTGELSQSRNLNEKTLTKKEYFNKIIFDIIYYITKKTLHCQSLLQILNIHNSSGSLKKLECLKLSNTKQFTDLQNYFKEKYRHFVEFDVRLPHLRNQKVKVVGKPERVIQFYKDLSDIGMTSEITQDNIFISNKHKTVSQFPKGAVVVYFPDNNTNTLYIGFDKDVKIFLNPTEKGFSRYLTEDIGIGNDTVLITNNGKILTKLFYREGLEKCNVIDVCLIERIIRNRDGVSKYISVDEILPEYGIDENLDVFEKVFQIYNLWYKQGKNIDLLDLKNIAEAESEVLWIISKMEYRGLNIDADKLLQESYRDDLDGELKNVNTAIKLIQEDNRLHEEINQLGKTGRIYSSIQNFKKDGIVKRLIKPDNGNVFIKADYSQFEPRILAGLSNDTKMIEIFQNGEDIYFHFAEAASTQGLELTRRAAKILLISIINGGERNTEFFNIYKTEFAEAVIWLENYKTNVISEGFMQSLNGRRCTVDNETKVTQIYNYPVQSTGADGFKLALIELDNQLKPHDAEIVHTVHDEIIVEATAVIAVGISDIVKEVMESELNRMLPNVPFEVEPEIVEYDVN